MARQDQKLEAARQAIADEKNHFETIKVDQTLRELIENVFVKAFIQGANWADHNPQN